MFSPIKRFLWTSVAMRKRSIPEATKVKASTSASIAPKTSVPRESAGSTRFAAKAAAKCPTSTAGSPTLIVDLVLLPQHAQALSRLAFFVGIAARSLKIMMGNRVNHALHEEFRAFLCFAHVLRDIQESARKVGVPGNSG